MAVGIIGSEGYQYILESMMHCLKLPPAGLSENRLHTIQPHHLMGNKLPGKFNNSIVW